MVSITQFSFAYVREHGFHKPKIPIIVSVGGYRTKLLGLLDSGSDYVLFPRQVAEALGIKLASRAVEADGIGGRIECRSGLATVTVRKGKESKTIRNMRIRVQTGDCGIDEILLGRTPFFSHFRIEFNENAKRVILSPVRTTHKE